MRQSWSVCVCWQRNRERAAAASAWVDYNSICIHVGGKELLRRSLARTRRHGRGAGQRRSAPLLGTRWIGVVAEGVGFEPTTGFPL